MAGFSRVPHGKIEQLESRLAQAGLTEEMIDYLSKRPALIADWVQGLRKQLTVQAATSEAFFKSPEDIYEAFTGWVHEFRWPFTPEQLKQLRRTMPANFTSRLDRVLSLEVWLGGPRWMYEVLWILNRRLHRDVWCWEPRLSDDDEPIRLLNAARYGSWTSVDWAVVDLTSMRHGCPEQLRNSDLDPGTAVLLTPVLHPDWLSAVRDGTLPGVWLSGMEFKVPGSYDVYQVPLLSRTTETPGVTLGAGRSNSWFDGYTVPVAR